MGGDSTLIHRFDYAVEFSKVVDVQRAVIGLLVRSEERIDVVAGAVFMFWMCGEVWVLVPFDVIGIEGGDDLVDAFFGEEIEKVFGFRSGGGVVVVEGEKPIALKGELHVRGAVFVVEMLGVRETCDDTAVTGWIRVFRNSQAATKAIEFLVGGTGLVFPGADGRGGEAKDVLVFAVVESWDFQRLAHGAFEDPGERELEGAIHLGLGFEWDVDDLPALGLNGVGKA